MVRLLINLRKTSFFSIWGVPHKTGTGHMRESIHSHSVGASPPQNHLEKTFVIIFILFPHTYHNFLVCFLD